MMRFCRSMRSFCAATGWSAQSAASSMRYGSNFFIAGSLRVPGSGLRNAPQTAYFERPSRPGLFSAAPFFSAAFPAASERARMRRSTSWGSAPFSSALRQ